MWTETLLLGDKHGSHHESGLVSAQTGGCTVLRHIDHLGRSNVLLLLSNPVCCDLQHQTLQQTEAERFHKSLFSPRKPNLLLL